MAAASALLYSLKIFSSMTVLLDIATMTLSQAYYRRILFDLSNLELETCSWYYVPLNLLMFNFSVGYHAIPLELQRIIDNSQVTLNASCHIRVELLGSLNLHWRLSWNRED